jgi:hypothetical protein
MAEIEEMEKVAEVKIDLHPPLDFVKLYGQQADRDRGKEGEPSHSNYGDKTSVDRTSSKIDELNAEKEHISPI